MTPHLAKFWLKIRLDRKRCHSFEAKSEYIKGIVLKGKLQLKAAFPIVLCDRETESNSSVRVWDEGHSEVCCFPGPL